MFIGMHNKDDKLIAFRYFTFPLGIGILGNM